MLTQLISFFEQSLYMLLLPFERAFFLAVDQIACDDPYRRRCSQRSLMLACICFSLTDLSLMFFYFCLCLFSALYKLLVVFVGSVCSILRKLTLSTISWLYKQAHGALQKVEYTSACDSIIFLGYITKLHATN